MEINKEVLKSILIEKLSLPDNVIKSGHWERIVNEYPLKAFIDAMAKAQQNVLDELKAKSIITTKQHSDNIKLIK